MPYRLLDEFRKLFDGRRYLHRKSTSGDFVAMHLYEDLYAVARSNLLKTRIDERSRVLNVQNRRRCVEATPLFPSWLARPGFARADGLATLGTFDMLARQLASGLEPFATGGTGEGNVSLVRGSVA